MNMKLKRDSFSSIYREYFSMVYNAVYTKIGNPTETEDLCQEIFLILYNKFDEVENPKKWLFGTIRNALLKYYRDKKPTVDVDEIFSDVSLTYVNGFRDARIIITEAIDKIVKDDNERQLIDLIAFNNFSYEHVAKIMGYTRRTVINSKKMIRGAMLIYCIFWEVFLRLHLWRLM